MGSGAPVWITRARPGAETTAARVAALGFEAVVDPLLAVETLAFAVDLSDVRALAFTSANGVEAFARGSSERGLPVFAVGRATARAAEAAGFDAVFVTDHPIPERGWLEGGGHQAMDPFVALSMAAAVTTRLAVVYSVPG